MTARCTVGLVDSGIAPELPCRAATRIDVDREGKTFYRPASPDHLGHGGAIARIILTGAPRAELVSAQIFHDTLISSPALIARGLDWVRSQGARLIVMALGVRADRTVLREACGKALDAGCVLLAAAPARGPEVYPAHYDGVIRAMGDARCGPGEISALMTARAHFGAPPQADDILGPDHHLRGASCAAAHIAARLATLMTDKPESSPEEFVEKLTRTARFHGPEHRRT